MDDRWQYLALMAGCLAVTLPLELFPGVRVYRRLRTLALVLLPVVAVFVVWDLVGIARDHWSYNPRFVTGIELGPMPLEELVFFVVIPICTVLTYEAVGSVLRIARSARDRGRRAGA
ncbi:lycopene cyclase domain-containing protein [Nocardioides sp. HDW12B]|uniref:lycopene cyclase domain-containing protein n=1 Tax=Nocardioides sp. HDW12B TaxID=2714939 RepID=UPI00140DABBF|nr:lycopene cyclase domain-containing protein [Nocardioides sp. HDW12B]QIK65996.1 lycopene cyclase domain-containing protein [Nocardioides sp. HDW12B]